MAKIPKPSSQFDVGTLNLRTTAARLNYVHRLLDRQTKKYLSESHDMTNAEWAVLGYLAWHSPQTVAVMSTETALFRSQVSRAIAELSRKKLVTRVAGVKDRRSPQFSISPEGIEVQRAIAKWAFRRQRNLEKELTGQQATLLNDTLAILARYLKSAG